MGAVLLSHIQNLEHSIKINPEAKLPHQMEENLEMVLYAMSSAGLNYNLTLEEFRKPYARDMMLFVLYLFLNLPNYIARATFEFEGALGETITKKIELTNPSKKEIVYYARIDGSPDFVLKERLIPMAPKGKKGSTVSLPIEFTSRFSRPDHAVLTLTSEGKNGLSVATMVFHLRSRITSRHPVKV